MLIYERRRLPSDVSWLVVYSNVLEEMGETNVTDGVEVVSAHEDRGDGVRNSRR